MQARFIYCFALVIVFVSCAKDLSGPSEIDFSQFKYFDFQNFRLTSPDTSFDLSIKTMIIRRPNFKRGMFNVAYDSTLKENLPVCSPLVDLGDTICPKYYQYFLIDSVWFIGTTQDKFIHRIEVEKVLLPDTTILDAWRYKNSSMVSEPPIRQLDSFTDKPLYARITITKKRIPSNDGINYSIDVHGDINGFWLR